MCLVRTTQSIRYIIAGSGISSPVRKENSTLELDETEKYSLAAPTHGFCLTSLHVYNLTQAFLCMEYLIN